MQRPGVVALGLSGKAAGGIQQLAGLGWPG